VEVEFGLMTHTLRRGDSVTLEWFSVVL
jgi:hypothetical protein